MNREMPTRRKAPSESIGGKIRISPQDIDNRRPFDRDRYQHSRWMDHLRAAFLSDRPRGRDNDQKLAAAQAARAYLHDLRLTDSEGFVESVLRQCPDLPLIGVGRVTATPAT